MGCCYNEIFLNVSATDEQDKEFLCGVAGETAGPLLVFCVFSSFLYRFICLVLTFTIECFRKLDPIFVFTFVSFFGLFVFLFLVLILVAVGLCQGAFVCGWSFGFWDV